MQEVVLNLLPNGVPPVCYISQYDGTSRVIRFHLLNGTEPLTLNGSETITLNFRKPNRELVTLEIENSSSNYIDLAISSELSDKYGEGFGEFRIQGLGTLSFKMYIESDAYGDSLKTRSISGPIATFETDLAEDLIKLDVDLEPVQDLHGYDYPWPAGGGKNKLDMKVYNGGSYNVPVGTQFTLTESATQFTKSGNNYTVSTSSTWRYFTVYAPVKANSSYYLGYVLSATGATCGYSMYLLDEDYKVLTIYNNTDNPGTRNWVITTTNDTAYVCIVFTNRGTAVNTLTISEPQLVLSSSATPYEPYSNICPVSGHDSAQLFRINKNLLEKPFAFYSQVSDDLSEMFFIKAGTYIVAFNETNVANWRFAIRLKDIDGNNLSTNEFKPESGMGWREQQNFWLDGANSTRKYRVLNIVKDCYIRILFGFGETTATTVFTDVQLEVGSVATDYEPYLSEPTPVTVQFGQTIYKGKLYSEQRKVLVTHVGMDLGYFTWNHYVTETRNYFYSNQAPPISPKGTVSPEVNDDIMSIYSCEKYADVVNGYTYSWMHSGFTLPATTKRLYIYDEAMENEDAAAFKTRVTGQQFVYEIAEPFYIDLTQIQTASIDSTPVASFETTLAMPLNTSEHSFSCSQAEGTPTPDSPIPITGVSEITAFKMGKNLAQPYTERTSNNGINYEVSSDGKIHAYGTSTSSSYNGSNLSYNDAPWHLKAGSYVFSSFGMSATGGAQGYVSIGVRKANGDLTSYTLRNESKTVTIDEDCHVFYWIYTGNGRTIDEYISIQIELSSSATPYEPYSGESITVSLGGTYYGGKLVQSEDGSRKLVLTHGLFSKAIANMDNTDAYPGWKNSGIKDMVGAGIDGSETGILNIGTNYAFNTKGTNDILYLPRGSYNSLTQTQWMANYPDLVVQIVVPLAEPIEVSLPDGDPLNAVVGENNVYCNTGDTALIYYYNMVADPIRIPALVGTNNVYSDAGDVVVEYYTTLEGGND